ncbi:MAG TPA: glycosyltransferase family 2 protein [Rectinemataceae bacterium]|nr:glycosyltransferase family 2 protein [Rectinemataceae bacterium]
MTRFSVIIPAYRARFLARAIASVLRQEGSDLELILFDDASPEPLAEIAASFADARIRYFRSVTNLGADDPSRAWNEALSLATGDFVVLLGDDDEIDPNYLAEMEALIDGKPGRDLYRCRLRLIGEEGELLSIGFPVPEIESWDEFLYFRNSGHRAHSTAEMCIRSSALRGLGGWPSMPCAIGSDDLCYLSLAARAGIASTNTTWASWRTHRRQISTSRKKEGCRLRALRLLGDAEKTFVEAHRPERLPMELLLQKLPGQGSRGVVEVVRSRLARIIGLLGVE